jgi:hypothetical protein
MKSNKRPYVFLVVALATFLALWLSGSTAQDRKRREVETRIYSTPEYRSDTARAVDAYERTMQRYMDLTERNLCGVSADIKDMAVKLDAIDTHLTALDRRLARIEKHLGIKPTPAVPTNPAVIPPSPSTPSQDRPSFPQPK